MDILEALEWRYATKQFDPKKKVSEKDLDELLKVLNLSPSSFGLQPWKFIVVTDQELRERLREAAWNQPQVTDASHLIVLCVRTDLNEGYIRNYIHSISRIRKVPREKLKGYEDTILGFRKALTAEQTLAWSKNQVYISLGFLLEACAMKRIDACPMEGFDPKKVDELLGLEEQSLASVVLCPIGCRSKSDSHADEKKVRFDIKSVVVRR